MVVYLASPIASTKNKNKWSLSNNKLDRNKKITTALENAGFKVYLPQANQKKTGLETLKEQLSVINDCEFMVIVLSDTRGIYLEAGYAKAIGKKIYALEVEETRKYSDWMSRWFDYIAKDIDNLIGFLKKLRRS